MWPKQLAHDQTNQQSRDCQQNHLKYELLEFTINTSGRKIEFALEIRHAEKAEKIASTKFDGTFTWSEEVDSILKEVFHLPSFRPLQREVINAIMSNIDTLVVMSTGAGKSLCYQLPAVAMKGLVVVISPLISLIEDQLAALRKLGIEGAALNQSTPKEDAKRIDTQIIQKNSPLRLLYITPEKLAKSKRLMNKLEKSAEIGTLKAFAIDEVHCCSQWGHDFRPDYKFLNILKRQFPSVPLLGLTATATANVLSDVKNMLDIPDALVFKAGFNRTNLYYEVLPKPDTDFGDELARLIKKRFPHQSGIVYCFSRKDCEEVANQLRGNGVRAAFYHADMDSARRTSVHEKWLAALRKLGVEGAALNQSTQKEDAKRIDAQIIQKNSPLRLLYITPEKLAKSKRLMNKLEKSAEIGTLKAFAIDEVHCCSQWGHDFRPDYKFLNILKRQFPNVPLLGLTATATANVLSDVKNMLDIPDAVVFKAGFNRTNLHYEVLPKPDADFGDELARLIKKRFPDQSGIVYCFSRKDCEEVANQLRGNGVRAAFYHADMDSARRTAVHEKWPGECRRKHLANHFEEKWRSELCPKACDVCANPTEVVEVDISSILRLMLNIIHEQKSSDRGSNRITGAKLVELTCKQRVGSKVSLFLDVLLYIMAKIVYIVSGPKGERAKQSQVMMKCKPSDHDATPKPAKKRKLDADDDFVLE
ncbi:ATP-dependent DNA helicase, RecQ family [Ancylostoma duodenale]|uniref:DNA 3'-5' helicase n=1 Tax=Ancylostoma duodenale TaxID=51022 RepID=A0A0C2GQ25_9BILA|nr:ATP-dependent DNA helicase, RecQ family [Ancylostoma duodenale]